MAGATGIRRSGNQGVDGLLSGVAWDMSSLTVSFPASASYYGASYGSQEPSRKFETFNSKQQSATKTALKMVADACGLTFKEIIEKSSTHATIRFAESGVPSTAWTYSPGTTPEGGDLWFNSDGTFDNPRAGNYAWATITHELGHALGLKHGHETDSYGAMPSSLDSMEFSAMSYRSYAGGSVKGSYTNETWGYAQTPMMYDIAALQHMYGADYTTRSGATTYRWDPNTGAYSIDDATQWTPGTNRIFMTVWDGGGSDTYDFSRYSTGLRVDLRPGEWTTTSRAQLADLDVSSSDPARIARGNIANALLFDGDTRSLVENAIGGSANDKMIGNQVANLLDGQRGDDTLLGNSGRDRLSGSSGLDKLTGGKAVDTLTGGPGTRDDFIYLGRSDSTGTGDLITDFEVGVDNIDVSALSNEHFTFSGQRATFDASTAPELRYEKDTANNLTHVYGDVNGDNVADLHIRETGLLNMTSGDFIL